MWALAKMMSNASAKLIATFFMVIILILLAFATMPDVINSLKEAIQHFLLTDFMRDPPVNAQGEMLFDLLITDAAVFGIIMTLIARLLVEILFFGFGALWNLVNPKDGDGDEAPVKAKRTNFYNEN